MTVEELSERILDEGTIMHYDDKEELIINQNGSDVRFIVGEDYALGTTDDSDSLENYVVQPTDDSDSLEHYGVLGMKWGVRKDRTAKVKKRDRRYEGESDQEYQARMNRESQERQAKARYKAEAKAQKRTLKSQERQQKLQMKSQEKQRAEQRAENIRRDELSRKDAIRREKQQRKDAIQRKKDEKAAERKRRREKTDSKPTNTRSLTDRELADAIQRLRSEQEYKKLSLQNKSIATKTLVKTATIGGGILLAVGTAVAKKQLTNVGNEKAEDFLLKKGLLKKKEDEDKSKGKGPSMSDFENLVKTVQEIREKLDL